MYRLTLTHDERQAIDWIGGRYAHGDQLYRLLCECDATPETADFDWDDERDITYRVPEHVAWRIVDVIAEDSLACFAGELQDKLYAFGNRIV